MKNHGPLTEEQLREEALSEGTPAWLKRCVAAVAPKHGDDTSRAFAICTAQGQKSGLLEPGSSKTTPKGKSAGASKAQEPGHKSKVAGYEKLLKKNRKKEKEEREEEGGGRIDEVDDDNLGPPIMFYLKKMLSLKYAKVDKFNSVIFTTKDGQSFRVFKQDGDWVLGQYGVQRKGWKLRVGSDRIKDIAQAAADKVKEVSEELEEGLPMAVAAVSAFNKAMAKGARQRARTPTMTDIERQCNADHREIYRSLTKALNPPKMSVVDRLAWYPGELKVRLAPSQTVLHFRLDLDGQWFVTIEPKGGRVVKEKVGKHTTKADKIIKRTIKLLKKMGIELAESDEVLDEGKKMLLPVNFIASQAPVENKKKFMKAIKSAKEGATIRDSSGNVLFMKTGRDEWDWYSETTGKVLMQTDDTGVYNAVLSHTTDVKERPAPPWPSMIPYRAGVKGKALTMERIEEANNPKHFFHDAKKGDRFKVGNMEFVVKSSQGYIEPPADAVSSASPGNPAHLLLVAYEEESRDGYSFVLDIPSSTILVYPWRKTKTDSRGVPKKGQKSAWVTKTSALEVEDLEEGYHAPSGKFNSGYDGARLYSRGGQRFRVVRKEGRHWKVPIRGRLRSEMSKAERRRLEMRDERRRKNNAEDTALPTGYNPGGDELEDAVSPVERQDHYMEPLEWFDGAAPSEEEFKAYEEDTDMKRVPEGNALNPEEFTRAIVEEGPVAPRFNEGWEKERFSGFLPTICSVCKAELDESFVDGRMHTGHWAYMCPGCFEINGIGLGEGKGRKYDAKSGVVLDG